MASSVSIEIIGFKNSSCSPFPCDETRSCGLSECHPSGKLLPAFEALKKELLASYGNGVALTITFLDNGMPGYVREIIDAHYPPLPIVLVNGKLIPVGRISLGRITKEIEKVLSS
jgi:hypothetical protein